MGYLVNVVQIGLEYADKYKMPEFVNKARCSSNILDVTVGKIDTLIREQGTPIVEKLDLQLDNRVAQVKEGKKEVMKRVETLQQKRVEVVEYAQKKKTEGVEYAQGKLTIVTDPVRAQTDKITAKVTETKQYLGDQAEEKKALLLEKAQEAATKSKTEIESKAKIVQEKATTGKAYAEKQLLTGAQKVDTLLKVDERLGSPYTEKAASYTVQTVDRVIGYSFEKATVLVQKSMALPLTLQERLEQGLKFTKDATSKTKAYVTAVPNRTMLFLVAIKVQLLALPSTLVAQKDALQASIQSGSLPADAQVMYARALKVAKQQAAYAKEQVLNVYTGVAPYVEQAKQTATQVTAKAKTEVLKLQPFLKQATDKVAPYVEQAKGKAAALFGPPKAKAAPPPPPRSPSPIPDVSDEEEEPPPASTDSDD